MKKLFAIAIVASLLSGLYGLTLGLGASYEDITEEDSLTGAYLVVRGDARIPVLPILDWRVGLLAVRLPEGGKALGFGTDVTSDLLVKIPMASPLHPYIVLGLWLDLGLEDPSSTVINLKGGLGAEYGFGPAGFYVEGGLNKFNMTKIGDADATTTTPIYGQAGFTFPINL
jgi:hypothetical protein